MISTAIKNIRYQKAFTLLEVLIALAVLSIGMITLVKVSNQNTIQSLYLKDKTIAQWVAINKVNEIKLAGWPNTGTSTGEVEMADYTWFWKLKVKNTLHKNIRQLEVEVRHESSDSEPLVRFISTVANI